jgi:hypothetical protein
MIFQGYGVKVVKIRNSKLYFQKRVGFILYFSALGVILCFTILEVYLSIEEMFMMSSFLTCVSILSICLY